MKPEATKLKKKKYPKLPNGFGQIKVYGGTRRKPVAAFPPATERDQRGEYKQPKPLAWCETYLEAFGILEQYNRERGYYDNAVPSEIQRLRLEIANLKSELGISSKSNNKYWNYTFKQIYEEFYENKYNSGKKYSVSTKNSTRAAFKNSDVLHDKIFRELTQEDLQNVIDKCKLKYASKELIVSLFHQMYSFAKRYDILTQDYSEYILIKTEDDDTPGVPFSEEERKILWNHKDDEVVEFIIIMCLSGYRIQAYRTLDINLEEKWFYGGVKSINGKNRYVPIHHQIIYMVKRRLGKYGALLPYSEEAFRINMYKKLEELGIEKHTPHDCRDTFATLADRNKMDKIYLKRLIGHSLSNDITESKYIKPTLEDLRNELEKISFP